jgi:hypothetical protein
MNVIDRNVEEEGAFDELKTHLCSCTQVNRPVVFRSMTPKRVEQELYGLLIAHNAVRMIMWAASCLVPFVGSGHVAQCLEEISGRSPPDSDASPPMRPSSACHRG